MTRKTAREFIDGSISQGTRRKRLRRSGLYEQILADQGGVCAICGETGELFIDHDHQTHEVRGLLCFRCNTGLGHFGDSPELLHRAISFLGKAHYPPPPKQYLTTNPHEDRSRKLKRERRRRRTAAKLSS